MQVHMYNCVHRELIQETVQRFYVGSWALLLEVYYIMHYTQRIFFNTDKHYLSLYIFQYKD